MHYGSLACLLRASTIIMYFWLSGAPFIAVVTRLLYVHVPVLRMSNTITFFFGYTYCNLLQLYM